MTTASPMTILIVGATGSIGRLVVAEALRQGHQVRALVRDARKAAVLPDGATIVLGDVTLPETLKAAVDGVDAVVMTLGSDGSGKAVTEAVDYGGVRNMLFALGDRPARIALMTAIGVTNRTSNYNRRTQAHDWKRRAERLVRASGRPYTIVRPGWFDYNAPDELRIVMLQGDTRHAGDASDGAIARSQIARVLVESLISEAANAKSFELVAERGEAQADLEPLFAGLERDDSDALDAIRDADNQPLDEEPQRVRDDLKAIARPHITRHV